MPGCVGHGCGDAWMLAYHYRITHLAQLQRRVLRLGQSYFLCRLLGSTIREASKDVTRARTLHGYVKNFDHPAEIKFCTCSLPCMRGSEASITSSASVVEMGNISVLATPLTGFAVVDLQMRDMMSEFRELYSRYYQSIDLIKAAASPRQVTICEPKKA